MQIVESSFIGLRSARIELVSDAHAARITLFPMVHVGQAAFYDQVAQDAQSHDLVLVEGVGGRVARRLTRAYRWAGVGRLNLIVQPKFRAVDHVRTADLSPDAFEREWAKVPVAPRLLFSAAAGLFGIWLRLTASRETLARGMSVDDLTSREDLLALGDERAPVLWALLGARDACLAEHLDTALQEGKHARIAVVYGACHMPAVLRHLQSAHGYRQADSLWMTVFSL